MSARRRRNGDEPLRGAQRAALAFGDPVAEAGRIAALMRVGELPVPTVAAAVVLGDIPAAMALGIDSDDDPVARAYAIAGVERPEDYEPGHGLPAPLHVLARFPLDPPVLQIDPTISVASFAVGGIISGQTEYYAWNPNVLALLRAAKGMGALMWERAIKTKPGAQQGVMFDATVVWENVLTLCDRLRIEHPEWAIHLRVSDRLTRRVVHQLDAGVQRLLNTIDPDAGTALGEGLWCVSYAARAFSSAFSGDMGRGNFNLVVRDTWDVALNAIYYAVGGGRPAALGSQQAYRESERIVRGAIHDAVAPWLLRRAPVEAPPCGHARGKLRCVLPVGHQSRHRMLLRKRASR